MLLAVCAQRYKLDDNCTLLLIASIYLLHNTLFIIGKGFVDCVQLSCFETIQTSGCYLLFYAQKLQEKELA